MRAALVIALALALAGCEHMYGAGDVRLSEADAAQIAQREALRCLPETANWDLKVQRSEKLIYVSLMPPECRDTICLHAGLHYTVHPTSGRLQQGW